MLRLCNKAGLVNVGVIAIDGTKVRGNASHRRNRDYKQLVGEILAEAERVDRDEDEQFGDARGDELPEQLQTAARRRAALKKARQKLERERMSPGSWRRTATGRILETIKRYCTTITDSPH